jgi:hypothetical protein
MFASVLKFIVVVSAIGIFFYCAGLAFQGRFEMKVILSDIGTARAWVHAYIAANM